MNNMPHMATHTFNLSSWDSKRRCFSMSSKLCWSTKGIHARHSYIIKCSQKKGKKTTKQKEQNFHAMIIWDTCPYIVGQRYPRDPRK